MKKFFAPLIALALMAGFSSCTKDTEEDTNDEAMQVVAEQYVNNVVGKTYTNLANYTEQLVIDLKTLQSSRTDANVQQACTTFLEARKWWELSEAFLFGAASDFGIDPHIDSWPLDEDAFNTMMQNESQIASLAAEDGDEVAYGLLGPTLCGFHGIEYILFTDGHAKSASAISDKYMIYAVAVAGDLRNHCYQLEVSWLGDKANASHIQKVEDLELNSTVNGGDYSYGENMLQAGKAGSTYASCTAAMMAILDGASSIADEVGTSKIGKCHTGEDPNYVESPYSQNSLTDFTNNIKSIQNAYMGGLEGERVDSKSLHNYMKGLDADVDARIVTAITNAIDAIQAIPHPFVNNYTDAKCQAAMDACSELDEALQAGVTYLRTH